MRGEIFRKLRGGAGIYDKFMSSMYLIVSGDDIIISDAAYESIGKPSHVSLITSRKDYLVGIRAMGKNDSPSICYKVSVRNGKSRPNGHEVTRVHATGLIADMALPSSKESATAYRATLDEDGDLTICLRNSGETFLR